MSDRTGELPEPPAEGTLEIRDPTALPPARPGAVRQFFFRSEADRSGEELLPTEQPEGWHLARLRAALTRRAQRQEQDGEVIWRVPWGVLVEALGEVLEEMGRDPGEAPDVLADAFRRAETAVEAPLPAAPPAGPSPDAKRADEAEALAAARGEELAMRAQEVRYLETRLGDLRQGLADAEERRAEQEEELAELQAEAAARARELEARLSEARAQAAGLEARLSAQTAALARREAEAREEEARLQRELARLDGLLRALVEELPAEGEGLPPGDAPARLAALRALSVELEACARERRAAAALVPLPDLEALLARLEAGAAAAPPPRRARLAALKDELLALQARWAPLHERARRGEARLDELLELAGLAQRACAREREADLLLGG
jgi:hypothetical protein